MNYMDKIAEMFGVNLGEEFRVKERGNIMFKITKEGLFNNTGTQDTVLLNEILTGRANIERCQWTPDFNERYYCWCGVSGNWYIDSFIYYDDDFDLEKIATGNCFKTIKTAEMAKDKIITEISKGD